MPKLRKSQGLSLTTIIVAAVALIVLVVLVAIFTGRMGGFSIGLDKTLTCQNSCDALSLGFENIETCIGKAIPGDFTDAPAGCCCT